MPIFLWRLFLSNMPAISQLIYSRFVFIHFDLFHPIFKFLFLPFFLSTCSIQVGKWICRNQFFLMKLF